jgi:hypothetical protein
VSETNKHVLSLNVKSKASAMTMVNQLSQQIKSKSQLSPNNSKSQVSQAKLKYEILDNTNNDVKSPTKNTNKATKLIENDKSQSNSNSPTKLEKRVDDIVDKCDGIFKSNKSKSNTKSNVTVKKESAAKSDVTDKSKNKDKQNNKTYDLKDKNNKKSKNIALDASEKSATISPRIEVSGTEDSNTKQKKEKDKSSKPETTKNKKDIDPINNENK